jgi:hypothetical protein
MIQINKTDTWLSAFVYSTKKGAPKVDGSVRVRNQMFCFFNDLTHGELAIRMVRGKFKITPIKGGKQNWRTGNGDGKR